jgi:MFS family permease
MSARSWWRRLDAERWVYRVGLAETTLLIVMTLGIAAFAIPQGLPLLALLPGALAALSGWLTLAWRRGRTWPWWVWTVGTGMATVPALGGVATAPSAWPVVALVVNLAILVLLCHPRSRARIDGPVPVLLTPPTTR